MSYPYFKYLGLHPAVVRPGSLMFVAGTYCVCNVVLEVATASPLDRVLWSLVRGTVAAGARRRNPCASA